MIYEERTMKSDKLYEGKMLNLRIDTVEMPDKKYSKREIIEHPGSVAILPIINNDEIVLVKQYRKAVEDFLYEIPAGKFELNEEPKQTAIRELKEETGYIADDIEYMLEFYPTPGYCDEKIFIFLANNLKFVGDDQDENEYIEVKTFKINEVIRMIKLGEIMDGKTIIAIEIAKQYIEKNKE